MKFHLQTQFGISATYIQSSLENFLFGTGQGSGASPAIWLLLSTVLLATLAKIARRGIVFKSPDNQQVTERFSDAYVDDTQNGVNDAFLPTLWSLQDLSDTLAKTSQSWERLLFCSGGSLELSKCFYYLVYWKWLDGLPVLTTKSEIEEQISPITLFSGNDPTLHTISLRDPTEAHTTLGVALAPTGEDSAQAENLLNVSNRIAALMSSSNLSRVESYLAYRTSWVPSIGYSLGTTCLSDKQLDKIQSQATGAFLSKIGINRNFPRAAAYAPLLCGGLDFRDLKIEQGISRVGYLMSHMFHQTTLGSLMEISLQTAQLEAGSVTLLLTNPSVPLPYLTECWITSLRQFMGNNQISLEFNSNWNFSMPRAGDCMLMDKFRSSQMFSCKELVHLNAVRAFSAGCNSVRYNLCRWSIHHSSSTAGEGHSFQKVPVSLAPSASHHEDTMFSVEKGSSRNIYV